MKKLKNWIITAETVKKGRDGLLNYVKYLTNEAKHKEQTLTQLTSTKNLIRTISKADKFNLRRKLSKGGRPSNYAWSLMFSYPFDISIDNLKEITKRNITQFMEYVSIQNDLRLSEADIAQIVEDELIAVVHKGDKINNHIHLCMPKHFQKAGKTISVDLSKKKYLHRIKNINNLTIHEILGDDIIDYQIKSHREHKKRVSKELYKSKQVYQSKIAQLAKNQYDEVTELYSELEQITKEVELTEENLKLIKRANKQLHNENTERAKSTMEKITKKKYPTPKI